MYFSIFEITLIQNNYTQKTITKTGKKYFDAKFDFIYSGQEKIQKIYIKELFTKNITLKTHK